ncbi:hypothetical protein NSQ29_04895 [Paenibacillus sp. FSL F4-0236]|uniref:AbiTii domain-containing protein n=1 Tax=unclassified Paenibacillus TaxID=185978 RepID=UPI0030F5D4B8
MARSQLLKDLVGSNADLESVLTRLKIILTDIDNELLMNWIDGELRGYTENHELPGYRTISGVIIGTYVINYRTQYTNSEVPLELLLSQEMVDEIKVVNITDGIASIQKLLNGESRDRYAKQIPTAFCHKISKGTFQIAQMRVNIPSNNVEGIVANVKSKLVDVVMELEKQFDNLDDLDIKSQVEEDQIKREQVIYNIGQIVYEGSVEIGDGNKIKKSGIGKWLGGEK